MALLPDELAPETHEPPQTFYEIGPNAGAVPDGSTKVGFTIRNSRNEIERGFAFLINPQGLTYGLGSRSTLAATKGGFYVDDFGPAPTTITMRQLVASGKVVPGGFYTAREDIQRFLETIYLPATAGVTKDRKRVFFHDHHFQRGFEQHVYLGPDSLSIQRSVDLHNLWLIELQMVSLEKYPYAEVDATVAPTRTQSTRVYTVHAGDTLHKIARRLAGRKATSAKVKVVIDKLLRLNPFVRKTRAAPSGASVKPMQLGVGEVLRLPT